MTTLEEAQQTLAKEWESLSPSTEAEIADFYVNAKHYDDDLDLWHQTPQRKQWSEALVQASHASHAQYILDIGAGAGHDIQALLADNPSLVIQAIEPNKLLQERLMELSIPYVHDDMTSLEEDDIFDMIYCIDVLEHVPQPDILLAQMLQHLKPNGIFVEATATHDIDTPLHLKSLRGWSPARFLDAAGFVIETNVDRLRIWHRVADKRPDDPSLLVCAYRTIGAETAAVITQLSKKGWRLTMHLGDALVSRVRSIAVSEWYQEDAGDVFLMIDDDILFAPEDADKVIKLARETRSIASAAYPVRGATHFASRIPFTNLKFGPDEEPCEITWAGTGFIAVHRDVIKALVKSNGTPICMLSGDTWFWPMFMPFIYPNQERDYNEYLSEDWAFCERARTLGFKVWLDPSVILTHVGAKHYTVFDMMELQEDNVNGN